MMAGFLVQLQRVLCGAPGGVVQHNCPCAPLLACRPVLGASLSVNRRTRPQKEMLQLYDIYLLQTWPTCASVCKPTVQLQVGTAGATAVQPQLGSRNGLHHRVQSTHIRRGGVPAGALLRSGCQPAQGHPPLQQMAGPSPLGSTTPSSLASFHMQ